MYNNFNGGFMSSYVLIGKIVGTHGIKGEIKILSDIEIKEQIFNKGFTLYFGDAKTPEKIITYRHHKNYEMVTLENYNNINEVLKYNKQKVYVKREDLIIDNYLLNDLLNYNVIENDKCLGKVINIIHNSSNILLEIDGNNHFYIPHVNEYIIKVDNIAKKIYVKNTGGLIL